MPRPSAAIRWLTGLLLCSAGLLTATASQAKDPERLRLRSLAATCAQCHGTDGRAVEGEALVRLTGLPQDYLLSQLMAFRSGERKATVMHQITKGYSQEQLEALAKYFAAQK
jgi:cytochrome subunit of sulfide dehydrogenase